VDGVTIHRPHLADRPLKRNMALGGPTIWTFEGGFGSAGAPGWGILGGWMNPISGAPNVFRMGGSPVLVGGAIGEIPQSMEELQEEQRRLEAIINEQPFEPLGGVVLEQFPPDVEIGVVPQDEDQDVAHTWGHLAREFIGDWINPGPEVGINLPPGQFVGGGTQPIPFPGGVNTGRPGVGCDGVAWSGGVPPKGYKVVNYCGQGVLRKIRRRRRRRMLTNADASDLATIVGIVGKGQMASSMINRTRS